MLSDLIAPGRLRDGEPQALAALVAVGGWAVVAYCEGAGSGEKAALAVVLAFVKFRRRAIEAGDGAGAELERVLLESARDAVDEVRGEAPTADETSAAEAAFARASPRPLSPHMATHALRALVEAAPVQGGRVEVRSAAERSYVAAYGAGQPAPPVAGERDLGPASELLLRAVQADPAAKTGAPAEPDPALGAVAQTDAPAAAAAEPVPSPKQTAATAPRPPRAAAVLLARRLRALSPAQRAAGFAVALVLVFVVASLLSGDDSAPSATPTTASAPSTVTVTTTTTAPAAAPAARSQVVRATPRRPFSAGGARFEVVPLANAAWAQRIRDHVPRRGTRWVTIAVRSRNVSRRDLVLRTLGYRLRTSRGVVLGPRVLDVAEGPQQARQGRLPRGARASVHLGFELPTDATGSLAFAFEPDGLDEPTVLVPI